MNFITLIRPYMNIFYLLGQTLYPLDYYLWDKRDKWTKWQRFSFILPTIFTFVLKLVLCAASFSMIHVFGESLGVTNDSITDLFLFCELLKAIAVLYQSLFCGDLLIEILRGYQTIEVLFQNTLNCPIHFTLFKSAYKKKIGWAFGSYSMLVVDFSLYYLFCGRIDVSELVFKIMQFISITVYMNVLFFIDLITFHLKHLNKIIANENGECKVESGFVIKRQRVCKQLSKYKFIHYFIWKITEQVNELFGWTLIAFTLQSFFDFVYITKWQLSTLNDFRNFMNLSRKNHHLLFDLMRFFR